MEACLIINVFSKKQNWCLKDTLVSLTDKQKCFNYNVFKMMLLSLYRGTS